MKYLKDLGTYLLMLKNIFSKPEKFSMYWKETLRQMNHIGVGSLIIVAVALFFIGAVTAVQFAEQLGAFGSIIPKSMSGYVVRESTILELAPTISGLLLAGKVGSNIASELGTMRISEQIDALKIMGINTTSYLVGPKIVGGMIVIPFLIIIAAAVGIYGGLAAGVLADLFSQSEYTEGLRRGFGVKTVRIMMIKSIVFAFIITSISCFQGFYVKGGALEIGAASTRAVVYSIIAILFANYLIASLLVI